MERALLIARCREAGVLPEEMFDHPTEGLCINLNGVRKLARAAPNKSNAVRLIEKLEAGDCLRMSKL